MGREEELVLHCLQARIRPADEQRIQHLLTAELDWEAVGATAFSWGVAPLFYYRLRNLAPNLPSHLLHDLAVAYLSASAQNAWLFSDLREVLLALRSAGIEVIALKGAALAETVYPSRAARPMSDIDLLVRRENLAGARDALLGLGYVSSSQLSAEAQTHISHHIQPLVSPRRTIVELHWTLARPDRPFRPDLDGLWQRARPTRIADVLARVLAAEDTLVYLSLQAAEDRFVRALKYLCDIAHAADRYQDDINWPAVNERARLWGAQHSVYLTLRLARELLFAGVPDETLATLQPISFDPRLLSWATDRLLQQGEAARPLGPKFMRAWNALTWRDRGRRLAAMLFPARNVVADQYHVRPDSMRVYWFYLVRLKGELRRTWSTVSRLLVRDPALTEAAAEERLLAEWLEAA